MFVFGDSFAAYCDNCGRRFWRMGGCPSIFEKLKNFKSSMAPVGTLKLCKETNTLSCGYCINQNAIDKDYLNRTLAEVKKENYLTDNDNTFISNGDCDINIFLRDDCYWMSIKAKKTINTITSQIELFDGLDFIPMNNLTTIEIKLTKQMCSSLSNKLGIISLLQHKMDCLEGN